MEGIMIGLFVIGIACGIITIYTEVYNYLRQKRNQKEQYYKNKEKVSISPSWR